MLFTIDEELRKKYSRLKVVGDIHGDYNAFKAVVNNFNDKRDLLIFLGDYADRGDQGLEIIEELSQWQKKGFENVVMLKGNHELYTPEGFPRFHPCDLMNEAEKKRGSWNEFFKNTMRPFLSQLYDAAILPEELLFVHAGVSSKINGIESLNNVTHDLERDLLWSDPVEDNVYEKFNSMRGEGVVFGKKLTKEICDKLGVMKIIRSHQPMLAMEKPHISHDGHLITTQSTSSYRGKPFLLNYSLKNIAEWEIVEL